MDLQKRKSYTALNEDNEPLNDVPAEILDKQEQEEQVQQLVKLATDSLQLHRYAVTVVQAILMFVIILKDSTSPFAKILSLFLLSASIIRSVLVIPLPPHFPPVLFNVCLSIPFALYTFYLCSIKPKEEGWETVIFASLVPFGAIILRAETERQGAEAVMEAKGLKGLMYDSPEA